MIEVLKQALEALEYYGWHTDDCDTLECDCGYDKAITSLRQAIKELESQEPVAWLKVNEDSWTISLDAEPDHISLYTHPPQRKPLTDEEVRKVARLFSNRVAEMCNVDADDHWKYHSEEVVDDVKFVLKAAHGIKGEA